MYYKENLYIYINRGYPQWFQPIKIQNTTLTINCHFYVERTTVNKKCNVDKVNDLK